MMDPFIPVFIACICFGIGLIYTSTQLVYANRKKEQYKLACKTMEREAKIIHRQYVRLVDRVKNCDSPKTIGEITVPVSPEKLTVVLARMRKEKKRGVRICDSRK